MYGNSHKNNKNDDKRKQFMSKRTTWKSYRIDGEKGEHGKDGNREQNRKGGRWEKEG